MYVQHIWEIPDQGAMRGGDLYDVYGNLTHFANTSALVDKTKTPVDKQINVKAHTAVRFMRDPAPYNVAAAVYERSFGIGRNKGALPGYDIMLVSDAGLPGQQKRMFQYTGTISALKVWMAAEAKLLVQCYGPRGSLSFSVPAATP